MTSVSPIIGLDVSSRVVPVGSTAAYSINDQYGTLIELEDIYPQIYRSVDGVRSGQDTKYRGKLMLQSVSVIDIDSQNANFALFFFDSQITVASTNNSAISVLNSQADPCLGCHVLLPDYESLGGFSIGSERNINLMLPQKEDISNSSLWLLIKILNVATFTTTTSVRFRFNFFMD